MIEQTLSLYLDKIIPAGKQRIILYHQSCPLKAFINIIYRILMMAHEVIPFFLKYLNEIYTMIYIANIANTYQLLFPMELSAVNDHIILDSE